METTQVNIDNLMSMVKAQLVTKSGVKLVVLKQEYHIESYLIMIKRIVAGHKMEKGWWPHYLVPQLAVRAQLAFAALLNSDAVEYNAIKGAILVTYNIIFLWFTKSEFSIRFNYMPHYLI